MPYVLTNTMQRAANFLGDAMEVVGGRTVRIQRGPMRSREIVGWVHQKGYDAIGEDGLETSVADYIWTFHGDEIVINGQATKLREGDRITETLFGVDVEYEVLPTPSEPGGEEFDTSGVLVLAHTKRVR